jgi:hypothetical protein
MKDLDGSSDLILAEEHSLLLGGLAKQGMVHECVGFAHSVALALGHVNYEKLLGAELGGCHHGLCFELLAWRCLLGEGLHYLVFLGFIDLAALLDCVLKPLLAIVWLLRDLGAGHAFVVICDFHARRVAGSRFEVGSVQVERVLVSVGHLEHIWFMLDVEGAWQDQSRVPVDLLQRYRLNSGCTLELVLDVAQQDKTLLKDYNVFVEAFSAEAAGTILTLTTLGEIIRFCEDFAGRGVLDHDSVLSNKLIVSLVNLELSAFDWLFQINVDVDQEAFSDDHEDRLTVRIEDITPDLVE